MRASCHEPTETWGYRGRWIGRFARSEKRRGPNVGLSREKEERMSRAPRSKEACRFWGDDGSDVGILHVDIDAFFVSVELPGRPELANKSVAVGGTERGVVSATFHEAREFGTNPAMLVARVFRICPHLVVILPRPGKCSEMS